MSHEKSQDRPVVLIAEDQPMVLQNAFDIVEEAGFTALGAPNGDHALRILESRDDICVLFTDVNMPGKLDGPKLAEVVRARWPNIRVIITSGRVDVAAVKVPAGTRLVQKPYRFAEIASHLRELSAVNAGC